MKNHPTKEHNIHPIYRPDIDGLRAIAIISVIIFHAFPNIMSGGFIGVDVFFVISGFLISTIIFKSLSRNDFSFIEFYAHRVQRIFPALILVLITCYTFGWFSLLSDEYKQLGKHIAAGAGFVQNLVLWQESGYFDTSSELKPLMHLWSLAIEEQFYIIFPALIWAVWRMRLNIISIILIIGISSFCYNVIEVETDSVKTFFSPQTRFWELMAGALLACMQRKQSPVNMVSKKLSQQSSDIISILGALILIIAVYTVDRKTLFPGWWALLPVISTSLIILAGPQAWVNHNILAKKGLVFIGLISYPLYLWHWPILTFLRILNYGTPTTIIRIEAISLSFILAWLTYRWIEQPLKRIGKNWLKISSLLAMMSMVSFIGYNTFQRNGLDFRYREMATTNPEFEIPEPMANNEECEKNYPEFAKTGFCRRSNSSLPHVLILGDSHADRIYLGMSENHTLPNKTTAEIVKSACVPFYDVISFQKGEEDECLDIIGKALKLVEDKDSIHTIILASRGPLYISGNGFGTALSEHKHDRLLRIKSKPELDNSKAVYKFGLKSTIAKLVQKGKNIIFVLDIAELDFDPKSCIESPLKLRAHPREICAVSRQVFDKRNTEYRTLVFEVLKDFPTVKVFDAANELCDENWCWAKKNNKMLYGDTNHLTLYGSKYIANSLSKIID